MLEGFLVLESEFKMKEREKIQGENLRGIFDKRLMAFQHKVVFNCKMTPYIQLQDKAICLQGLCISHNSIY